MNNGVQYLVLAFSLSVIQLHGADAYYQIPHLDSAHIALKKNFMIPNICAARTCAMQVCPSWRLGSCTWVIKSASIHHIQRGL